jgi:hypothetical protein
MFIERKLNQHGEMEIHLTMDVHDARNIHKVMCEAAAIGSLPFRGTIDPPATISPIPSISVNL